MKKTYWNNDIPQWTLPTYPPQKYNDSRSWIKFSIGKNEYYGKKLDSWGKTKIVVLKIIPLFVLTITLAPVIIPLFFALGTYRKLGIWIREVHHSKTIKHIVNVAASNLNKPNSNPDAASAKTSNRASPKNSAIKPFNVPDEIALLLLSMPSISNSKEARRYLQSLSCVSKSMQPLVEQTKVELINAGVISIGELPGINNDLKKALNYIDSVKTKINNLNLFGLVPSDEDIETIFSNCPNVTSVTISCTNITIKGLEEITKVKSLTSLHLSKCYRITDKALEEVGKLKSLTSLHLRHCNAITDKSLEEVAKLRSLTSLDLRCSTITDKAFEKLADLKDLTSLSLMYCSDTTDKDLEGVAAMESLTFLNLMGCYKITDEGLKEVAKLQSLTSLDLGGCNNITDEGLKEVAKLQSLTSLNLLACNHFTDEGLKEVAKLQSLTSLYLDECDQITDIGRKKIIELAPWISIYP